MGKKDKKKKKKHRIARFFILIILLIILAVIAVGEYGYVYYSQTVKEMPLTTKVVKVRSNGKYVTKEKIPKNYFNAVVAVEDHRFYNHGAVDPIGIVRATVTNAKNQEFLEGGSTITQQVAKNLYYINKSDDIVKRKVAEIYTAIELENNYRKDEILELYANIIYFGNGYYGIYDACKGYLGKEPKDMTLAEATMLAGIPNAPSVYAPTVNKELCIQRQKKVISDMVANGYLTQQQANSIDNSFINNIN